MAVAEPEPEVLEPGERVELHPVDARRLRPLCRRDRDVAFEHRRVRLLLERGRAPKVVGPGRVDRPVWLERQKMGPKVREGCGPRY